MVYSMSIYVPTLYEIVMNKLNMSNLISDFC